MRYQGSKARLAKHIIPIITEHLTEDKYFIDLFGGGMNLVCNVDHKKKIACDINLYVIMLWKNLQQKGMGIIPKDITKEEYEKAKVEYLNNNLKSFTAAQIGYIATCCSYGGGWFNGYANFNPKKNENHIQEAYNGLKKQVENFKYLKETQFFGIDYKTIEKITDLSNSVVYCDIPYSGKKKYESDFDHRAFWDWVRYVAKKYHTPVYISEYEAPADFKCVWQKDVPDGMATTKNGNKQNRKIEKLFVYNGKG